MHLSRRRSSQRRRPLAMHSRTERQGLAQVSKVTAEPASTFGDAEQQYHTSINLPVTPLQEQPHSSANSTFRWNNSCQRPMPGEASTFGEALQQSRRKPLAPRATGKLGQRRCECARTVSPHREETPMASASAHPLMCRGPMISTSVCRCVVGVA